MYADFETVFYQHININILTLDTIMLTDYQGIRIIYPKTTECFKWNISSDDFQRGR